MKRLDSGNSCHLFALLSATDISGKPGCVPAVQIPRGAAGCICLYTRYAPIQILLLAAYLPGRIQHATKHPMLVAVKLWATALLLVNGTLADVALFGKFLVWAVADRISLKHRESRPAPNLPETRINDGFAVIIGLACYAALVLWLHAWLTGIAVIPG